MLPAVEAQEEVERQSVCWRGSYDLRVRIFSARLLAFLADTHPDCSFFFILEPFVTPSSFETLFQLLVGSFTQQSTSFLVVDTIPSDSTTAFSDESESESLPSPISPSFSQLETLLRLVAVSLKVRPDLGEQNPSLFVEAFIVGYLLPKSLDELVGSKMESTAKNVWVAWASVKGSEGTVLDGLKAKLADALGDVNVRARYGHVPSSSRVLGHANSSILVRKIFSEWCLMIFQAFLHLCTVIYSPLSTNWTSSFPHYALHPPTLYLPSHNHSSLCLQHSHLPRSSPVLHPSTQSASAHMHASSPLSFRPSHPTSTKPDQTSGH